ncbi:MAG: hypothetical protein JW839_00170 [Candidatus Lokiarchaeota archaeon]|nr:hypothetical protein [Candidatus Lokiarchaeota archaeon]
MKTTDPLSAGRTLLDSYTTVPKVAKLCRLGTITALGNEIQDCTIDVDEARPSRLLTEEEWRDFTSDDLDPDGLADVDWIFLFNKGKWTFCTRCHTLYLSFFLKTIEEYFVGKFIC